MFVTSFDCFQRNTKENENLWGMGKWTCCATQSAGTAHWLHMVKEATSSLCWRIQTQQRTTRTTVDKNTTTDPKSEDKANKRNRSRMDTSVHSANHSIICLSYPLLDDTEANFIYIYILFFFPQTFPRTWISRFGDALFRLSPVLLQGSSRQHGPIRGWVIFQRN